MTPPPHPTSAPGTAGRIVKGVAVILGWAAVHYALFILLASGGFIVDFFLGLVKSIFLPGTARNGIPMGMDVWGRTLTIGLCTAGAAGIPLGLAIIYTESKRRLRRTFWALLLIGFGFELAALYQLIANVFDIPTS